MGPDPYFNNVPKEQWPDGTVKLTNTELFQSINPLFIVVLTLIFVPLFDLSAKKRERANNSFQVRDGNVYLGIICIGDGFCYHVCAFNLYT